MVAVLNALPVKSLNTSNATKILSSGNKLAVNDDDTYDDINHDQDEIDISSLKEKDSSKLILDNMLNMFNEMDQEEIDSNTEKEEETISDGDNEYEMEEASITDESTDIGDNEEETTDKVINNDQDEVASNSEIYNIVSDDTKDERLNIEHTEITQILSENHTQLSCDDCSKSFSDEAMFNTHRLTHTSIKPFSCEECSKSFTTRGNLQVHKRLHSGEKPFKCGKCSKSFRQKGTLQNHKCKGFQENLKYKCDQCSINYNNTNSLSSHYKLSHFPEYMGNLFTINVENEVDNVLQSINMEEYLEQNVDNVINNFDETTIIDDGNHESRKQRKKGEIQCEDCDITTETEKKLQKHIKITHPKKYKPYKCSVCEKGFKGKAYMETHKKNHGIIEQKVKEEKPFPCEMCGKSFKTEWYVKTHQKSHTTHTLPKDV